MDSIPLLDRLLRFHLMCFAHSMFAVATLAPYHASMDGALWLVAVQKNRVLSRHPEELR